MKRVFLFAVFSVLSMGAFAGVGHFKKTHIKIVNQTSYVEILELNYDTGVWEKPLIKKALIPLAPGDVYRNTISSVVTDRGEENFASFIVARKDHPNDDYLIYVSLFLYLY